MKKLIIDTDIGSDIDDTWALVYALCEPQYDIKLIIVSSEDVDYRANLVLQIIKRLGKAHIPVAKGIATKPNIYPQGRWLDTDGEQSAANSDYISAYKNAVDGGATDYVVLGPFSTLKSIMEDAPDYCPRLKYWAMAGAVDKGYINEVEPGPECNVVLDWKSAAYVLAKAEFSLAPLDVCRDYRIDGVAYKTLIGPDSPAARVIMENYRIWQEDYEGGAIKYDIETTSSIIYDLLPFMMMNWQENFVIEAVVLSVDSRGRTVRDTNGSLTQCALSMINEKAMTDYIVDTIVKAGKNA